MYYRLNTSLSNIIAKKATIPQGEDPHSSKWVAVTNKFKNMSPLVSRISTPRPKPVLKRYESALPEQLKLKNVTVAGNVAVGRYKDHQQGVPPTGQAPQAPQAPPATPRPPV